MPLYEYNCQKCGAFTQMRPLAESGALADCPVCGKLTAKVFPLIHLRSMSPINRTAWERNERSAHAPDTCGARCSHRKPAKKAHKRFQGSTGLSSRPWMLGH
jgi:putative FmdB family regulatory protein